jgi:integrase
MASKDSSSRRTVPLPEFAISALTERRGTAFWGQQPMIFPSSAGSWRDPDNFNNQWRKVRDELGAPEVTSHGFRKSMADLIDSDGFVGAGGRRPIRPRQDFDDSGQVHVPRPRTCRGREPLGPHHRR